MHVCVYVCVCMYVCMYVRTYVRTYVCFNLLSVCASRSVCKNKRMYVCVYVSVYLSLSLYIYIYTHVCVYIYIYIYINQHHITLYAGSPGLSAWSPARWRQAQSNWEELYFFFVLTRRVLHSSCGCSGGEGTPPETLKCLTPNPCS